MYGTQACRTVQTLGLISSWVLDWCSCGSNPDQVSQIFNERIGGAGIGIVVGDRMYKYIEPIERDCESDSYEPGLRFQLQETEMERQMETSLLYTARRRHTALERMAGTSIARKRPSSNNLEEPYTTDLLTAIARIIVTMAEAAKQTDQVVILKSHEHWING
jgi:hypothetical protein